MIYILTRTLMTLFSVSCVHPPSEDLYVLPLSFKSQVDTVLYGTLMACQRAIPSDDLRFRVIPLNGVNVTLLNDTVGDFMFTPEPEYEGIVTFWYLAWDERGTSELSTVTISVKREPSPPSLNVSEHVVGLENTDVALDIAVDSNRDHPYYHDLSVAICDCGHNVTCNRESKDCHCHLSLPRGWEIFTGDHHNHMLSPGELNFLDLADASNLVLRASPPSSAEHCLDVHVVTLDDRDDHGDDPSIVSRNMTVTIYPYQSTILLNSQFLTQGAPHFVLHANTTQGRPYRFSDLMMVDSDGVHGEYFVKIQLDRGGLLWVGQDGHNGVDFFPKTVYFHPKHVPENKTYRLLDRFGTFKTKFRSHRLEERSNGVKILIFAGSLEDINEVLKTLTYVPWCSDWPTPPSWSLPEDSWMRVNSDPTLDPHHPDIWPQWYPRFWYPFNTYPWSWWPRVLPPWWMTSACSDWTSIVHIRVRELEPSPTCHPDAPLKQTQWSTKVEVTANHQTPKSLVTSNHFSYFQPDADSAHIDTVYMRSLDYDLGGNMTISLTVLESKHATAEFSSTGQDHVTCVNLEECNNHLMNIRVVFKHGAVNMCHVTVQIDLLKQNTTRLGDRLVVWAVNTTQECLDVTATHSDFELTTPYSEMSITQGSHDNPMSLTSNVPKGSPIQEGIIHVKVFAEHGLVTMIVPDGLRLYSDHMGQHEGIPTYLCIAGPVSMVMDALATARLTPLKHLRGDTHVTVDYRMPSTASKLLYGEVKPFHRLQLQVTIRMTDIVPSAPVVIRPPEVCVTEPATLPINMITIRTLRKNERLTFDIVRPQRGSLFVNTSDKGIYKCPDVDPDSESPCVEMCGSHLDCPDTQLCCSNGCGRSCQAGTPRALLHVTHSGQVIMHGDIRDVHQNILRNAVQYIPAPCHLGETAYTDTLTIRIIPAVPPEYDLAREVIPIHVACSAEQQVVSSKECEWSDWSVCHVEGNACGTGHQERHRNCSSREYVENRPCLNCTCSTSAITVSDPCPSMKGCSTNAPVFQCPVGCSVSSLHTETVAFQCSQSPGELTMHELIIHDACICDACTFGRKRN